MCLGAQPAKEGAGLGVAPLSERKQQHQGRLHARQPAHLPTQADRICMPFRGCFFYQCPCLELTSSRTATLHVTRDHTRQARVILNLDLNLDIRQPGLLLPVRPRLLSPESIPIDPLTSNLKNLSFVVSSSTPPCLSSEERTPSSSLTPMRSASKRRAVMAISALLQSPWPLPLLPLHLRCLRPSRPSSKAGIASPSVR